MTSQRPARRSALRPRTATGRPSSPRPGSRDGRRKRAPAPAVRAARPGSRDGHRGRVPAPAVRVAPVESVLARQPWAVLAPHIARAGADSATVTEQLRRYAQVLLEWNRGASNLISRRDEGRLVERHILESIVPAAWLKESGAATWLDLGSGGGLPAIPLGLVGVGTRWTLVESRRNKTLFLLRALRDLGLGHFDVVRDRLENIVSSEAFEPRYDGFTARATLTLGPTLELAAKCVRAGGTAFLWKGSRFEDESSDSRRWSGDWEAQGVMRLGESPAIVARFVRK